MNSVNSLARDQTILDQLQNIDIECITRFKLAHQLAEIYSSKNCKISINILISNFILLLETYTYEELLNPELINIYSRQDLNYDNVDDIIKHIASLNKLCLTSLFGDQEAMKRRIGNQNFERVQKYAEEKKLTVTTVFKQIHMRMLQSCSDSSTNWTKNIKLYLYCLEEYLSGQKSGEIELPVDSTTIPGYLIVDFRGDMIVINIDATMVYCTYDKVNNKVDRLTEEHKIKFAKTTLIPCFEVSKFSKIELSLQTGIKFVD